MSVRKGLVLFGAWLLLATSAAAQQASKPAPAASSQMASSIADAWGGVLTDAVPANQPSMPESSQMSPHAGGAADFINRLYIELRTEYWHTKTDFNNVPTATGVINDPSTTIVTPAGIPYTPVFQPTTDELYSLLSFGTRGWLSDRVNTDFTLRYRTDLSNVNVGNAAQNITNTFPNSRKFELQTAYIEINGKPGDGFFDGATVRLGRQYTYGAELAAFDGASFGRNRPKYSFAIFGGRRFTYYSDPEQRGIGGVDFVYRFGTASLEYSGLFYVKGSHVFSYRQRLPKDWLLNSYFRLVGSHAADFAANGLWTPTNGKTTLRLGFFQKLTNRDYFYDYTEIARDRDRYNRLLRLYLGPRSTYSQFNVDLHRQIIPRLRIGGAIWLRQLNDDAADQGPFDTSFRDYTVDMQLFPLRRIETVFQFHQRDLDRKDPRRPVTFDDMSASGETRVQDFSLQVGRSFGEGRLSLRGGGFLRRLNFQDQFFFINDAQTKGWLVSATTRLDQHTRFFLDYSLDTDFYAWRPSIKNGQVFRLGLDWKY